MQFFKSSISNFAFLIVLLAFSRVATAIIIVPTIPHSNGGQGGVPYYCLESMRNLGLTEKQVLKVTTTKLSGSKNYFMLNQVCSASTHVCAEIKTGSDYLKLSQPAQIIHQHSGLSLACLAPTKTFNDIEISFDLFDDFSIFHNARLIRKVNVSLELIRTTPQKVNFAPDADVEFSVEFVEQ